MTRRYLTQREKGELLDQQADMCALCHEPLDSNPDDPTEWDHALALGLGGGNETEAFAAVHQSCHKRKSTEDVRMMRKADRQRRKMEEGRGRKRKGREIRSAGFKGWRGFDGTVRWRDG